VFYVGKGLAKRVRDLTRNKLHTNIANKHGVRREIVLENASEAVALALEVELIALHKTFYLETGWGANFTRGGEGVSGYRRTDGEKARISAALKGRKRVFTAEHRANLCKSPDPLIKFTTHHSRTLNWYWASRPPKQLHTLPAPPPLASFVELREWVEND
jgi:hypothetical protein